MANFRPEQLDVTTGAGDNDTVTTQGYVDDQVAGSSSLFEAFRGTDTAAVTGNSEVYTIIFDNTSLNIGGDYSTGTGIYTCPSTGYYEFSWSFRLKGLSASHNSSVLTLQSTGGIADVRFIATENIGAVRGTGNQYVYCSSIQTRQVSGAAIKLELIVSGGATTVIVEGFNIVQIPCFFTGRLIQTTA